MTQAWTIIDGVTGKVRQASFLTSSLDEHPVDAGWDFNPSDEFIPIDQKIDPGLHVWKDGEWSEDIEILRENKWREIKEIREAHRYGGFVTTKGKVNTDEVSQRRITSAARRAERLGAAFTVNWTMFNDNVRTFNAAQMLAVELEVGEFEEQCHAIGTELRTALKAATTKEQIDAIQWPA